ncbi:hypothetical protein UFOVP59_17 [uncultured Caudovirales phage]|uniref:Uncharacterized protein n=1 Tax=uncultured Caudovirales phage TaxID=2100421 RepID=A0A6J7WVA5_9CAUD|nr:hypothetical protein UFOVP59_17 [uncultured Caudovirales phage]CAB5220622.1 hypothetical protein UFOVP246_15 [uncultured Caudovirales phage]
MIKSFQEHIDHIMDHFDFNRVEKAMKALDWVWFHADTENGIPDVPTLRKEARRLLTSAWDNGMNVNRDWQVSTGGFTAKLYWLDGSPLLELSFVVEDSLSECI